MSVRFFAAPLARGVHARLTVPAVSNNSRIFCRRALSTRARQSTAALQAQGYMARRHFGSSAVACKAIGYKLADIGEGIAEAEVLQWFVEVGDEVKEFDKICEVQSDKATVEITSRYDGKILSLHYKVGDMAKVGQALVDIDMAGEGEPEAAQPTAAAAPTAATPASSQALGAEDGFQDFDKKLATPAVRRIAKEGNIDIAKVHGSGKDGRILKEDILSFLSGAVAAKPATATAATAAASTQCKGAPKLPAVVFATGEDQKVPIRGIQRAMVKSMERAKQVPHFTYGDELDMSALVELRKQLKPIAETRGVNLSYLPFILKAMSLALNQYPMINAHVNDDCTEVTYRASHNIGVAMDTPMGLLVPNVKNVQARSVFDIAAELNRLQKEGMAGKMAPEDMQNGTISLSNIGAVGGTYMRPVILCPEVAIAALGRFQTVPRFDKNGSVVAATISNISWSGDHRVLDGATMARFSNAMKTYLENPQAMFLDMK